MNDNEKVAALADSLLRDVNAADLPLGVKALALENLLLRVEAALHAAAAAPPPAPGPEAAEPEGDNAGAPADGAPRQEGEGKP